MISWNEFVQEFGPTVYKIALHILGRPVDAEDVTQEVFLEAYRLWTSRNVASWIGVLRPLATLRAIDCLRKRKHEIALTESAAEYTGQSPESVASIRELQNQVRKAIARLPQQQAEVFSMHFLEGLSHQEIASLLDIDVRGVASALHKARAE